MKTESEIISSINNVEFDSNGDPLYSFEQLKEAMHQLADQEKEKEAKEFAEYFEKYVACVDEMVAGIAKDMRFDKDRPTDYDYYNFNTKQWAKDFTELYQQFKERK